MGNLEIDIIVAVLSELTKRHGLWDVCGHPQISKLYTCTWCCAIMVPGMRVKIGFAVDGREWTDPKTGKMRYFSDLTALRLERLDAFAQVTEPAVPDDVASELDDDSGIPF